MKMNLFDRKLKPLLESLPSSIRPVRPISLDMVKIIRNNGKIRADVECLFCSGPKKRMMVVQCNSSTNTDMYYWNISNFKKHLGLHTKSVTEKLNETDLDDQLLFDEENTEIGTLLMLRNKSEGKKNKTKNSIKRHRNYSSKNISFKKHLQNPDQLKVNDIMSTNVCVIEDVKIDCDKSKIDEIVMPSISANDDMKTLLEQMSQQNLKNISTTRKHSENSELMTFNLNSKDEFVEIANIDPNGSCFFGSIAHQLYGCQINSEDHEYKTKMLRDEAVLYMKQNFDIFKFHLQARVYEKKSGMIMQNQLEGECRVFLNACLPNSKCFAGCESVKAISEVKGINIITISESGECYMAAKFKREFQCTVFLALRLGNTQASEFTHIIHNDDRNHYDSVTKIDHKVLYKLAEHLTKMNDINEKFKNNSSIISLNSTL